MADYSSILSQLEGPSNVTEIVSEENETGTFQSIMAGLGSGLFKIPEGIFSLGATLIDLGADTNKAADVEEFFAKINPFDEMAAATTAGKITELITNLAIPGGIAFKLGNTAVKAAKGGKYLNLSGNAGKNIEKGIKKTVNRKNKIKAFDEAATSMEKAAAFAAGAGAGGVAEGIFVGDVEDAGTFGDLIGGPTALEREIEGDVYDPGKEILNRIKFGTEGALFTGVLGSAGAAIKKLKDTRNAGKVADKGLLDFLKKNLSSSGRMGKEVFETSKRIEGAVAGDINMAETTVQEIDGLISGLFPYFKRLKGDKVVDAERRKILEKMNKLILSGQTTPEQLAKLRRLPGEKDAVFAARRKEFLENSQITPTITGTKVLNQAGKNALENSKRIDRQLKLTKERLAELNKSTKEKNDPAYLKAVSFNTKKYNDLLNQRRRSKINPKLNEKQFLKKILENKKPKELDFVTEEIQAVSLGGMNKKLQKEFIKDIKKLQGKNILKDSKHGKALEQDISDMMAHLGLLRMGWNKLFSMVGARLDTNGVRKFEELFGKKISTWLDRSYNVFKGRNTRLLENYPITAQAMKDAKAMFQKVYQDSIEGIKGVPQKLTDSQLQQTINNVVSPKNLKFDRGFRLADKGDPSFRVPGFFVGKSSADEVFKLNNPTRLSELTGIQRDAMNTLLGKNDDALQTIITATQDLSSFVRNNQLKDELLIVDKTLKKVGRTGIFADTLEEGTERFAKPGQAIQEGVDFKQVGQGVKRGKRGLEGLHKIKGSRGSVDYDQTLKPIRMSEITGDKTYKSMGLDEVQPTYPSKAGVRELMPILDPIADKYALTGNVDALFKPLNEMANSQSLRSKVYQNLILYPKATSQMAKTILSPFTHARNFISAGAFAMANGMIPFADREAVRQAWNALQTPLLGTRKAIKAGTNIKRLANETDQQFKIRKANYLEGNEFYQKLLKLGVVNSQVQLGDLQNLLGDVKFGGITGKVAESLDSYGLNRMLKFLGKAKKVSEDLYTAEDDFWKIFSFIGEGKRLRSSYRAAGISGAQEFHDLAGAKRIKQLVEDGMSQQQAEKLVPTVRLTEDFLDNEAALIVRNNIPNYGYVSDFVKGLRKWPIGNFVSFPSEIIRTGTNVVERALDEIFYRTTINGKLVSPLRNVGIRRLSGMAFTTAAVPAGVVAGMSALYDVTEEERAALKTYVAEWSKNSTLVPIRDSETGKLSVIDFSHSNAYDTLSRPIQTILNKVAAGEGDRDGMMDDFFKGMIEATKELGQPFISESIWTEALSDLWMRGGKTREGFDVWEDKDSYGTMFKKGIAHLGMSQAPFNWKQLERLGLSMRPVNDLGRIDDRGNQYEFGKEALGIIGFRAQEVDPNKGIVYKIAQYNRDARDSKSLFTQEVLKGGVTTPKQIIDAYINANRALFITQKTLYKDINDAKILNASKPELAQSLIGGIGRKSYGKISNGVFTPVNVSKKVRQKFQKITEELQKTDPSYTNPLYDAFGAIANISAQLFNVGLEEEEMLPKINNPFNTPLISNLIGALNKQLPPLPNANMQALNTGTQFGNVNTNISPADQYAALFPGDTLGKLGAQNQTSNKNLGQT